MVNVGAGSEGSTQKVSPHHAVVAQHTGAMSLLMNNNRENVFLMPERSIFSIMHVESCRMINQSAVNEPF